MFKDLIRLFKNAGSDVEHVETKVRGSKEETDTTKALFKAVRKMTVFLVWLGPLLLLPTLFMTVSMLNNYPKATKSVLWILGSVVAGTALWAAIFVWLIKAL